MISRRQVVAGLGLTAVLPRAARADADAQGFQVIRARRAEVTLLADAKTATKVWSFSDDHQPLVIRARQGQELKLRHTPELIFKVDHSEEYSRHIEDIISTL